MSLICSKCASLSYILQEDSQEYALCDPFLRIFKKPDLTLPTIFQDKHAYKPASWHIKLLLIFICSIYWKFPHSYDICLWFNELSLKREKADILAHEVREVDILFLRENKIR